MAALENAPDPDVVSSLVDTIVSKGVLAILPDVCRGPEVLRHEEKTSDPETRHLQPAAVSASTPPPAEQKPEEEEKTEQKPKTPDEYDFNEDATSKAALNTKRRPALPKNVSAKRKVIKATYADAKKGVS